MKNKDNILYLCSLNAVFASPIYGYTKKVVNVTTLDGYNNYALDDIHIMCWVDDHQVVIRLTTKVLVNSNVRVILYIGLLLIP